MNDINDIFIKDLKLDSRLIKSGDLFIALSGIKSDGRSYIPDAIEKGAVAVLCEHSETSETSENCGTIESMRLNSIAAKRDFTSRDTHVPIIKYANLRSLVGTMAARFYNDPSQHIKVIGVTGTSGKTSITHFIAQILENLNKPCAILGTLGFGFISALKQNLYTTPDPIVVQKILSEFVQMGSEIAAMEVTSHALMQHRVEGVKFHTTLFSNLTHDHLDYHTDMENYWCAKEKLFKEFDSRYSLINIDDPYGKRLLNNVERFSKREWFGITLQNEKIYEKGNKTEVNTYVQEVKNKHKIDLISIEDLKLDQNGIRCKIRSPFGEGVLESTLYGLFNVSNLLMAIAAVCLQGFALKDVLAVIPRLTNVPGRMMRFGGAQGLPLVIVDYAHKPDALYKVLQTLKSHCSGRLWCVFGCGGDRDRTKRPLMTRTAYALSDNVILTQDNPRFEDPNQIFSDMLKEFKNVSDVIIEFDRKKAIRLAIQAAKAEDIILIAGKGHETYQIIRDEFLAFSDEAEVLNALAERS